MKNVGIYVAVAVFAVAVTAKTVCPHELDRYREKLDYTLTCNNDYAQLMQTLGSSISMREEIIISAFEKNVMRQGDGNG